MTLRTQVFNFSAGPATLPIEVIRRAQDALDNFQNSGIGIGECSHRGSHYEGVHNQCIGLIRELLEVPEHFKVLLLPGGATMQFTMVPLNCLTIGKSALYLLTGNWSKKAYSCAQDAQAMVAPLENAFDAGVTSVEIPETSHFINHKFSISFPWDQYRYVHITSNNTIRGTQWKNLECNLPEIPVPYVVDASSDIMTSPINWDTCKLVYAGAQKNIGMAGVAMVILDPAFLPKKDWTLPPMLDYQAHIKANSCLNTPPTFNIFVMKEMLAWIKNRGGVERMQKAAYERARMVYEALETHHDTYELAVRTHNRSTMNITFRLKQDEDETFLKKAAVLGLHGLKGHRSVGGMRASMYNGMPKAGAEALTEFIHEFATAKVGAK